MTSGHDVSKCLDTLGQKIFTLGQKGPDLWTRLLCRECIERIAMVFTRDNKDRHPSSSCLSWMSCQISLVSFHKQLSDQMSRYNTEFRESYPHDKTDEGVLSGQTLSLDRQKKTFHKIIKIFFALSFKSLLERIKRKLRGEEGRRCRCSERTRDKGLGD